MRRSFHCKERMHPVVFMILLRLCFESSLPGFIECSQSVLSEGQGKPWDLYSKLRPVVCLLIGRTLGMFSEEFSSALWCETTHIVSLKCQSGQTEACTIGLGAVGRRGNGA